MGLYFGRYCKCCDHFLGMDPVYDCEAVMPFGKHAGKKLQEIPAEYLSWVVDNTEIKTYLSQAIKAEMRRRKNANQ